MVKTFIVCDLETTGLDPGSDKIIEVGLVRLEEGRVIGTYHTLVNPGRPLTLKIKRLTGLDDSDLLQAPPIAGMLSEILDFIGDIPITGHNVQFDLGFLAAARGLPLQNQAFDTLELARLVAPAAPGYRLDKLCSALDIDLKDGHRALNDALATARLLTVLVQKLRETDPGLLITLNGLLQEACSNWSGFLADLIKDILKKFPNKKIAAAPYWKRDEDKQKNNAPRRERFNRRERLPLVKKDVTALVGKEGRLAAILPGYEYRPQQEKMVGAVNRALGEEKFLLMEAGTGVGKSMAYLIPLVLWSLLNGERVLVATHTINLQEQLWLKDIPLLARVIEEPFRAALAKGRQNYICLRRWFSAIESRHQPEEAAFYARVLSWLTATSTGDKGELNISPSEGDFWLAVCGEAEGCLGSRCSYQKSCFVNKARRAAEEADLIIANHSLLFADVRSENRVLPSYGPLIIDEAHHLEESATAHLGRLVSQSALNRWLVVAGRTLAKLGEKAPPGEGAKWLKSIKSAQEIRLEAAEAARFLFQLLWEMAAGKSTGAEGESGRLSLRLPCCADQYADFLTAGGRCADLLRSFAGEIENCIEFIELWSVSEEAWVGPAGDLSNVRQSGLVLAGDLQFILENRDEGYVYWAELETYSGGAARHCTLLAAPINVGSLLYECFFKEKSTVVLASATLSVNGNFSHFIERTGLNRIPEERLLMAHFNSPFAYDRQALLCVNRDLPVQGTVKEEVYLEQLENTIFQLLQITGGGTLVLFTSHRTLRETYWRLKPRLEALDICLLGHGIDGSRSRIMEEFKTTGRTVLFGSSSFWEGVDVPGDALTCVIMVKLPFQSPAVPVVEARLEDLARQNRDGFQALSIPQAVIRFKQGFGRLIRSGSDRGCVVVLDRRLLTKSYGRHFLNSLPLKSHIRGGTDLIGKKITEWTGKGIIKNGHHVNTWKEVNFKKIAHSDMI